VKYLLGNAVIFVVGIKLLVFGFMSNKSAGRDVKVLEEVEGN
jgi:hypothetical protein